MKKNTIIILFIFIISILFITNTGMIFSQDIKTPEQLFERIRTSYTNKLPQDFTAEVKSEMMEKELSEVPDFEKVDNSKPFTIMFIFLKDFGERLIVDNACLMTRNKFQDYLEVYKSFRSFLDPTITTESFFRQYKWEIAETTDTNYIIKMYTRGILNEYYEVYVNKDNLLVEKSLYYKDKKLNGKVDIEYTRYSKYFIPKTIKGYTEVLNTENETEKKSFDIELYNYKVNNGLTVDDILGDGNIDC